MLDLIKKAFDALQYTQIAFQVLGEVDKWNKAAPERAKAKRLMAQAAEARRRQALSKAEKRLKLRYGNELHRIVRKCGGRLRKITPIKYVPPGCRHVIADWDHLVCRACFGVTAEPQVKPPLFVSRCAHCGKELHHSASLKIPPECHSQDALLQEQERIIATEDDNNCTIGCVVCLLALLGVLWLLAAFLGLLAQ